MIRAFDAFSLPLLRWFDPEDAHRMAIQGLRLLPPVKPVPGPVEDVTDAATFVAFAPGGRLLVARARGRLQLRARRRAAFMRSGSLCCALLQASF